MSSFDIAIGYVLENEGPDSNDPSDSGGLTRWGLTADDTKRHGIDIHALTLDQAKAIYLSDYWPTWSAITDQRVATKLFDMGVNEGVVTAIHVAQNAAGVLSDGVMGPKTIAAINAVAPEAMLDRLMLFAMRRYVAIVLTNHTQLVFLRDWTDRALRLP